LSCIHRRIAAAQQATTDRETVSDLRRSLKSYFMGLKAQKWGKKW